jgi:outer membrane protein assembly factor BamB
MGKIGRRIGLVARQWHRASIALRQCGSVLVWFGASALLSSLATAGSPPSLAHYPAQPFLDTHRLCVSSEGIYCFDADTLEPVWSRLRDEHTLEPVLAEGRALVGSSRGIYAFDASSGRVLWHHPVSGLTFTPTVAAGTAYIANRDGALTAVDVATGKTQWTHVSAGWKYPPAILDEWLVTGGRSGEVIGIDRRTGAARWRHDVEAELVYRPVAAGDTILATTFDGQVFAFTAQGTLVWHQRDAAFNLPPAVSDSVAVFASRDGTVRSRSLDDGELLWRREVGTGFRQRPQIEGDEVAVVDGDGRVAILNLADGACRLSTQIKGKPLGSPTSVDGNRWIVPYRGTHGDIKHFQFGPLLTGKHALGSRGESMHRNPGLSGGSSNIQPKGPAALGADWTGHALDACFRSVNEERRCHET